MPVAGPFGQLPAVAFGPASFQHGLCYQIQGALKPERTGVAIKQSSDLPGHFSSPKQKSSIPRRIDHAHHYHQQPEEFGRPGPNGDIFLSDPSPHRSRESGNGNDGHAMPDSEDEEHHASCQRGDILRGQPYQYRQNHGEGTGCPAQGKEDAQREGANEGGVLE